MIVGHTRCSVDGGIGSAKKKFRSSDCDTPQQLESVINSSAANNRAKLLTWPWRDWDTFLAQRFRAIKGITKYQHFMFSHQFPGKVKMAETVDGDPVNSHLWSSLPSQSLLLLNCLPFFLLLAWVKLDKRIWSTMCSHSDVQSTELPFKLLSVLFYFKVWILPFFLVDCTTSLSRSDCGLLLL